MPVPTNFQGLRGVQSSKQDNFASFAPKPTPPPAPTPTPTPTPQPQFRPPTPPSPRSPEPDNHSDFSGQPKDVPSDADCQVECDSDGNCYCPVPRASEGDSSQNGTASDQDVSNANKEAQDKLKDITDLTKDVGDALTMASLAANLLNAGNAFLNGVPIANDGNRLMGDVNQLKMDGLQLQANVNRGIDTLNQGMANRNRAQIQDGFNQLEAAKAQAAQVGARAAEIQGRADSLQSRAQNFEQTTNLINAASQGLSYGGAATNLFGQSYQAAVNPTTENIGSVSASFAQTGLKGLSEFTSFLPSGAAQFASAGIEGAKTIGISAGQGRSPTEVGLGATSIFGGQVYSDVKQAYAYAQKGNDAMAAQYGTFAALGVVGQVATFTPVGAPVNLVGIPVARGITAGAVAAAQGYSSEQASYIGADVFGSSTIYGKISRASNMITGATFGETGYLSPDKPISAIAQTIGSPLVTTQRTTQAPSYSSRSTGQYYTYNPSAGSELAAAKGYAQQQAGQVYTAGDIPQTAYQSAGMIAKPILDKYGIPLPRQYQIGTGIAPANFATE